MKYLKNLPFNNGHASKKYISNYDRVFSEKEQRWCDACASETLHFRISTGIQSVDDSTDATDGVTWVCMSCWERMTDDN